MSNANYGIEDVEKSEAAELTEIEKTYGGMIDDTDKFYQDQINASKAYAAEQKRNQQAQTDFAIQKIEQQKAEAKKDYTRETAGAYADWQKQSNAYGANAEQIAAMGMAGSGYSESSQVAMFNTYQNRVATARESYNLTVMNFNNAITEARLQNNSALAEIAYKAQQQQLELALNGFQYKNQLVIEKANKRSEVKQTYYQRYRDVLAQINTENELKLEEEIPNTPPLNEGWVTPQNKPFAPEIQAEPRESAKTLERMAQTLALRQAAGYNGTIPAADMATLQKITGKGVESKAMAPIEQKGKKVITSYYIGAANPDAKMFGTFANGYQPKGISGHGVLTKTGDTIQFPTEMLNGNKVMVKQNVWEAADGTLWYWEGRENAYKPLQK